MAGELDTASVRRSGVAGEWAVIGVCALLFCASVAGTIYLRGAMLDGMGMGMGMGAGMDTGMLGQVGPGAAVLFLAMWVVMMAAMMLPSLAPALVSYPRIASVVRAQRLGWLTALAGAGYFGVWAAIGLAAYALVAGLTALGMQWPGVAAWGPIAAAGAVLLAGGFQLMRWKTRRLQCCREASAREHEVPPGARGAWQWGPRLGAYCGAGCAGYVAILLASGMTDLGVMALVAAGITIEHIAPRPALVAHAAGGVLLVAGGILMVRALGVA